MALKICEHCNKAFLDEGGEEKASLCFPCAEFLDALYCQAWTWLRDHSSTDGGREKITSAQLAEMLHVDVKSVDFLVKMGRIQTSASSSKKERTKKDLENVRAIKKGVPGRGRDGRGHR